MRPNFHPGDRLLVFRWARPRVGDVVAVSDPRQPRRLLVKRVTAVSGAGVDVRGDNPTESTDSRHFGPVAPPLVLGRAVYRYAPPARTGPVGRRWSLPG